MTPLQRPARVTLPVTIGLFFGGGVGGTGLAHLAAPDSIVASGVGLLALPIAFIAGLQLWLGFALLSALVYGMRRLLGQVPDPLPTVAGDRMVPPGAYSFVATSLAAAIVAGVVMGLVATHLGFFATLFAWLLAGSLYGLACWWLARNGFIPFPDE